MDYDVAVVGAGPAGCVVARKCAEAGYSTVLFEKNRQLGQKVCGGFLEPRVIEEFDIDPEVIDYYIDRFSLHTRNHSAVFQSSHMFGYGIGATVRREKFDPWLAKKAVEAGAKLQTSSRCLRTFMERGQVSGVEVEDKGKKRKVRAAVTVAADGFYSKIARSARLIPRYRRKDFAVCLQKEVYLKETQVNGGIHIVSGNRISRCGYGWLFPKKHGYTVGVGILANNLTDANALPDGLNWLLKKHPFCSDLLRNANKISKPKFGCIPMLQHRHLSRGGLVAVGDAAGQVSSTSGGGIYYALKAAEMASEVIIQSLEADDNSADLLREYDSMWKSTLGRELHFQKLLFDMSRINYKRWQELMLLVNKSSLSAAFFGFALFCLKTALPYF